ncbi:MAG: hypothetical protein Q4E89_13055 [Eubacteriales bacterium]|nr:hypothetical protein [Eubacteriales bacterium]
MFEIIIAVFLGAWLVTASVLAYLQLKKDFKPTLDEEAEEK